MNILPYNIEKKILKHSANRHRAFYYHYFTSNIKDYNLAVNRWQGKKKELVEVLDDIRSDNLKWQEKKLLNNERNLSGTQFKRFNTEKRLYSLDYTVLDYCLFEFCKFETLQNNQEQHKDSLFWSCKINHSHFKNCKFKNVSFSEGEFQHIVFYECEFENVDFNKNKDGIYNYFFFQNCTFKNVDFTKLSLKNSCFWGPSVFDKVRFNQDTIPNKKLIGKSIVSLCKSWDKASYRTRLENKYLGGPYNKIEILYTTDSNKRSQIKKFSSLINCYEGLDDFYRYISKEEDKEGEFLQYLNYYYLERWVKDQKYILLNGRIRNYNVYISRYVLGYGVKSERPLMSYLSMILGFSFVHLFNGIIYGGRLINRDFQLDFDELIPTVYDFFKSLYFSAITSTTIGYGDIHPGSPLTMFIASAQGIIGVLLMTMFTVIFGRRFFK